MEKWRWLKLASLLLVLAGFARFPMAASPSPSTTAVGSAEVVATSGAQHLLLVALHAQEFRVVRAETPVATRVEPRRSTTFRVGLALRDRLRVIPPELPLGAGSGREVETVGVVELRL